MQKIKNPDTLHLSHTQKKKQLKIGHRPKDETQYYKLLEESIRESASGLGDEFLDTTPKAWPIEEKIVKLDLIKIKNFSYAKDSIPQWQKKKYDKQ